MPAVIKKKLHGFAEKYKSSDVVYRAGVWFIAVSLIDKGVSILTQPFFNRILSVEEIGVYNVYFTWHSIVSILATLNLFCGVLEVQITKSKNDIKQAVASLMTLSILVSIPFFAVSVAFGDLFESIIHLRSYYLPVMCIDVVSIAIVQFWCVPKRFEYSYKQYSIVTVILFLLKCVSSILLSVFIADDRVFGRIIGMCLPEVIFAIFLLVYMLKGIQWSKITYLWKYGLKFNLPLLPHYLASILLASSDKVMIEDMCGKYEVGIYSVGYSIANLTLIAFMAVNNAYTPFAMNAIKQKNYKELNSKTNIVLFASAVLASVVMLMAPEGIMIMGGEKYLPSLKLVPILIVGVFISSSYFIFSNVEFFYEKTKYIFPITIIGSGINILLNWLLIPKIGYEVAAITTFIGYIIIAVLHYVASVKIAKEHIFNISAIVSIVLFLIIMCIMAEFLYSVNFVVRYAFIIIIVAVTLYLFVKKKLVYNA